MKIKLAIIAAVLIFSGLTIYYDMVKSPTIYLEETEGHATKLKPDQWKSVPDITFTDLAGKTYTLNDFKGKIVLLNFWATWCPTCIKDFPGMLQLAERFNGDLIIVAISNDEERKSIDNFLASYESKWGKELKSPYLHISWDQDKAITSDIFNTVRFPETIIISKDSRMVKKMIGEVEWTSEEIITFFDHLTKLPQDLL